ncbi:MAG: hypothetical protein ACRYGL_17125 [Janthinobacterium lividum]
MSVFPVARRQTGAGGPPAAPRPPLARALRHAYSTLTKQVFRATHPRDQRHNERFWPHVAIERDAAGRIVRFAIRQREIPIANADVFREREAGRHAGTAHLIACGPSIRSIDYATLRLPHALGVNGAVALAADQSLHFDYYCVTDTLFVRGKPDMIAEIIGRDLLLFTTPLCLWHILQHFDADAIRCRIFLFERVDLPASQADAAGTAGTPGTDARRGLTVFDAARGLGFSEDIRDGVFPGGTVAYESLQILNWLGFTRFFLHGVDLGNAASEPRFYETPGAAMPTTLHLQLATEIEPSFRQAAGILRAQGATVRNLSPVSALGEDIFPRTDWRTLRDPAATGT